MVREDGRTTEELDVQFDKLLIIAQAFYPALARNMERGVFDAQTDVDTIKLKLIAEFTDMIYKV